jgi:hypothetical protein
VTNDIIKLNAIVNDLDDKISELAEMGQGGFKVPFVITPDELAEMIGASVGPWRPQSNDLLWFYALKIAVYAREILEQSGRIFQQMDDSESAERVQSIVETIDEQFHPCETALEVYRRLLNSNLDKSRRKSHCDDLSRPGDS